MENDSDYTLEVNAVGRGLTQHGVSLPFEPPQTSDYNNNTVGTNLWLWTPPYSVRCFFLPHFPVLFHR